ncbi:unnamed protein product [Rhizophagus irregularis]|nr:unnamed protein product [Rhizophagus irregularis]
MFKDQITTPDGSFLESWATIKAKPNNQFKGRTPACISYRHSKIVDKLYHRPKKEWSSSWSALDNDVVYGKTIEQVNEVNCISTFVRHSDGNSPTLQDRYTWKVLQTQNQHFNSAKTLCFPQRSLFMDETPALSSQSFSRYQSIFDRGSYHHYQTRNFIGIFFRFSGINFYTDGALRPPGLGNPNLFDDNTTTTNMGFGWVHKNDTNSDLNMSFFGGTSLLPSSSKAEAYAILTALLVAPTDSVVKIYTDSMNCVHTFQRVNDPLVSTRKILKIPNHDIWRLIKHLIEKKNLTCLLLKLRRIQAIYTTS